MEPPGSPEGTMHEGGGSEDAGHKEGGLTCVKSKERETLETAGLEVEGPEDPAHKGSPGRAAHKVGHLELQGGSPEGAEGKVGAPDGAWPDVEGTVGPEGATHKEGSPEG